MILLGARVVYVPLVGRGMPCSRFEIAFGASFPKLLWLHLDGAKGKLLCKSSWCVACQQAARRSKMEDCLRTLCQHFVRNI